MLFHLWKGFFLWTAEGAEGAESERSEKGFAYNSKYILSKLLTQDLANTWQWISQTPGVCGGDACMRNTRFPVWVLENFRRLGMNESRLLDNYPKQMRGLMRQLSQMKLK